MTSKSGIRIVVSSLGCLLLSAAGVYGQSGQHARGRILVGFRAGVSDAQVNSALATVGGRSQKQIGGLPVHVVGLPARGNGNEAAYVQALKNHPLVEFAELDEIVPPADVTPNDPLFSNEWHLAKIQAPAGWSVTTGSPGVIIAILDSGVNGTHEDLAPKMVPGWNVYDNNSDTHDVTGHGTEVAGTAAAAGNNGLGVVGVAFGCWIMPVRIVQPTGQAAYSDMAAGLTWAADHGARVANISFGASGSQTVQRGAAYFQSLGGVVAMAAGNTGSNYAKADAPAILTVSATDPNDAMYGWSSYGSGIDISAPGCVYTTQIGGGYGPACGTSFASPIVAGAAALVLSRQPGLSPAQVQSTLEQSADDLGAAGKDIYYGWGRVNLAKALGVGGSDNQPPNVWFVSPTQGATVAGLVNIQASATDNVGVASVAIYIDNQMMSSVNGTLDNWGWNTASVANGSHTLKAVATDAAGNSSTALSTVTVNNGAGVPTVTITSPSPGSKVSVNQSVTVQAQDDVAVTKVELYVDGALAGSSTRSPFTLSWKTNKTPHGNHTLQCKVYDGSGNVGVSQLVVVSK